MVFSKTTLWSLCLMLFLHGPLKTNWRIWKLLRLMFWSTGLPPSTTWQNPLWGMLEAWPLTYQCMNKLRRYRNWRSGSIAPFQSNSGRIWGIKYKIPAVSLNRQKCCPTDPSKVMWTGHWARIPPLFLNLIVILLFIVEILWTARNSFINGYLSPINPTCRCLYTRLVTEQST